LLAVYYFTLLAAPDTSLAVEAVILTYELLNTLLKDLISDIEQTEPQKIRQYKTEQLFELSLDPLLTNHLSGWIGAVVIRNLLQRLNINEHHVFRWRLENKFRQYQILNHYVPGCMPSTFGLQEVLNETDGAQKIKELLSKGYFVKATLGHGSGRTKTFNRSFMLEDILNDMPATTSDLESWMLQQMLVIQAEIRIHSFERRIIKGLTFPTGGEQGADKVKIEEFVEDILRKLPESIVNGTLLAWDVALMKNNECKILETNVTGYHPEFAAGFQTTGYVDDEVLGPIVCAWLNTFFKKYYQISISNIKSQDVLEKYSFLRAFNFYKTLVSDNSQQVFNSHTKLSKGLVLYIEMPFLQLMLKFLTFLNMTSFTAKYVILCPAALRMEIIKYTGNNTIIQMIALEQLFSSSELELLRYLGPYRRRQMSFSHVQRTHFDMRDWMLI
jgi:hypothetical protein